MSCLYLLLTIVGFTCVTFFMKWGGQKGQSPLGLASALFIVASLITALPLFTGGPLAWSRPVLFYGVLAGVGGAVALLLFANALKIGHYGFSVAILHMSCLVPVIFSVLFLGASFSLTKGMGLALILLGLFLITCSNASSRDAGKRPLLPWVLFISSAFFLNAIPQVAQSLVARALEASPGAVLFTLHGIPQVALYILTDQTVKHVTANYAPFLFVNYLSGAVILSLVALRGKHFNAPTLLFGTGGALGSVLGYFCVLKSLELLPAPVVFPISLNGPVVVATVLSRLFFREEISWLGYLGILTGITGIVILAL